MKTVEIGYHLEEDNGVGVAGEKKLSLKENEKRLMEQTIEA